MFKKILSILLVTAFVFTVGATAFANDVPGYIHHKGSYVLDGDIDWRIHTGSVENGAQQKTVIKGEGTIERTVASEISLGKLTVSEEAMWSSHPQAMTNLQIVSSILVGFSPAGLTYGDPTRTVYTEQVYAWLMRPYQGEAAQYKYGYTATDSRYMVENDDKVLKSVYIDSFAIDFDAMITNGKFGRYIDMSSATAKSPYTDYLFVDGSVTMAEVLEVMNVVKPFLTAASWFELF